MEPVPVPRIDAVGVLEVPEGYRTEPRRLPRALRVVAAAVLLCFVVVGTATTVASLGRFCLTSQAGPVAPSSP